MGAHPRTCEPGGASDILEPAHPASQSSPAPQFYTSLPNSVSHDNMLAAWNQPQWECLHQWNGQRRPLFIYFAMPGLSCSMQDLVPWPGIKPVPPVALQAPLSMVFSRQEYWSELPCPRPGDIPDPGIKPGSPVSQADSLPSEPPGRPWSNLITQSLQCKVWGAEETSPSLSNDDITN